MNSTWVRSWVRLCLLGSCLVFLMLEILLFQSWNNLNPAPLSLDYNYIYSFFNFYFPIFSKRCNCAKLAWETSPSCWCVVKKLTVEFIFGSLDFIKMTHKDITFKLLYKKLFLLCSNNKTLLFNHKICILLLKFRLK